MNSVYTSILLFLILSVVQPSTSYSQDSSNNVLILEPLVGISWRSDALEPFTFKRVRKDVNSGYPLNNGGGFSGLGLNIGLSISYHQFGLEYTPSFLYDVLYFTYSPSFEQHRKLTIDHGVNFTYRKKLRYSIGYNILYDNTQLEYFWDSQSNMQDIEYDAWSIAIGYPIKDILIIEGKIMYSRNGFPNNPEREAMLYGLRLFHSFNIDKLKMKLE